MYPHKFHVARRGITVKTVRLLASHWFATTPDSESSSFLILNFNFFADQPGRLRLQGRTMSNDIA